MDQSNPAPAQTPPPPPPAAPAPTNAPTPPPLNPPPPSHHRSFIIYPILIIVLLVGIGLGYLLFSTFPGNRSTVSNSSHPVATEAKLTLPPDAVQIQACSDHRGTLYVKPSDIPVGPVYMVSNGQVIGIEYMLSQQEFLSGKSFKDLAGNGVKVDHVNIGLLSQGHEGYPIPHYHVDMYTVPQSVEQAIVCPSSSTASSSATPSVSSSASPAAATSSATPQ